MNQPEAVAVAERRREADGSPDAPGLLRRIADRMSGPNLRRPPARPPYGGARILRGTISILLAALCLLNVGGAVLLLLLWQQDRANGVLTTQLDRTWDLLETLQVVEWWVAVGLIPVGVCWIVLAALNVGRASGVRRNPIVAAVVLVAGVAGIWLVGRELVAASDDPLDRGGGWAIQVAIVLAIALVIDRIASAAEAKHGPSRLSAVVVAGYLAQLQFLGGLSNLERQGTVESWGQAGAYLLISGLILVVGSFAINEAVRSIEDATEHRYELRSRFSESLLAQAALR